MKKEKQVVASSKSKVKVIDKMEYRWVDEVFHSLNMAFHPDGFEKDQEPDERFLAHWHLFLVSVGWTEDEFWEASENLEHTCPDCGSEIDHEDDDLELAESSAKTSSENKPN